MEEAKTENRQCANFSAMGILLSHIKQRPVWFPSNPVALPVLYFYWSLYPVAAIVLSEGFIVSILLPIVSFSNHRPRLERYRLSQFGACVHVMIM